MIPAHRREDEALRLDALRSALILDTPQEPIFDSLINAAAALCQTPIALLSLVEDQRQWFKSRCGLASQETPRDPSICAYVVQDNDLVWVEDASQDVRFYDNPLVTGPLQIRLYAGAPIRFRGQPVGSLCIIDIKPRPRAAHVEAGLRHLADAVSDILEKRAERLVRNSLIEATPDAVICTDDLDRITVWNTAAQALFGWSAEEMLGQTPDRIKPERMRGNHSRELAVAAAYDPASPMGKSIELPALARDGREFPIEVSLSLCRTGATTNFGSIIRDLTERKRIEASLAAALTEAQASDRAKGEFLANMSHEIRTPLNGIVGVADVLARSGLDASQREMADLIGASAQVLVRVVSDVLDLARLESDGLTLEDRPFSLEETVQTAVGLYRPAAEQKALAFEIRIDPAAKRLWRGDAVRIRQILGNLVSNAIKFTESGWVRIEAGVDGSGRLMFTVGDTGLGFGADFREQIFDRFTQADASITRKFGGSGLGLSLCKGLVERMGGEIRAWSEPGVGSRFTVLLPLTIVAEDGPEADGDGPTAPGLPSRALSILLAEDHPANRRVVELILAGLEVELTATQNGREAVDAFLARPFDVVLMDMQMPVMDGLSAIRAIREIEAARGRSPCPILMLTANALPEHEAAASAAGADALVSKPLTAASLLDALSRHVSGSAEAASDAEARAA